MEDLSEKFRKLMARMAKTDAELFRTINDHNKAVTDQVMDLTTEETQLSSLLAIAPPPLVPLEDRSETALKNRFHSCKAAFDWIEQQIGPPPTKKRSWSIAVQTVTSGKWEIQVAATKSSRTSNARINNSLDQINQRLEGIEAVLGLILNSIERNLECN